MILRDAATEALRELALPTIAAVAFALLALPLIAESGVVVRQRAILDGTLAVGWLLSVASGLRLGALLGGQGLGPLLRPVLGDLPFLAHRLLGYSVVLTAQAAVFLALAALHTRHPGLLVHGVACALEGLLAVLLTALVATAVRPWLGAVVAAALLWVGHLEQELVAALGAGGPVARVVLLLVPSVEGLNVQGALLAGAPLDPAALAVGLGQAVGWCLLTTLLLRMAWARTDRG